MVNHRLSKLIEILLMHLKIIIRVYILPILKLIIGMFSIDLDCWILMSHHKWLLLLQCHLSIQRIGLGLINVLLLIVLVNIILIILVIELLLVKVLLPIIILFFILISIIVCIWHYNLRFWFLMIIIQLSRKHSIKFMIVWRIILK